MKSNSDRIRLNFSNGTQYQCWLERNCCLCKRYFSDRAICKNDKALGRAQLTDGTMKKSLALEMGFDEKGNPPAKLTCLILRGTPMPKRGIRVSKNQICLLKGD